MISRKIYLPGLFFLLAVSILHYYAVVYELYFHFWWMDILTHFMAGIGTPLIILVMLSIFFNITSSKRIFWVCIISILVIGIGWEIWEYANGLVYTAPRESYTLDVIIDLIMDTSGGLVAYFIGNKYGRN